MNNRSLVAAVMVVIAAAVLVVTLTRRPALAPEPAAPSSAPDVVSGGDVSQLAAAPHLLFRHSLADASYMHLSVASLDALAGPRGTTPLVCDRLAFAGGRGICLRANRGMLTTYDAVIFDASFAPKATLKLDGAPSRTRIAPNGQLGAITVFVTGQEHGYSSGSFSTKTTLVDLATGKVLGDLESFKTLRDGKAISAPDFNFWGVTFARDGNTFYATLMTAQKTYLVRGDVNGKTMTVLREDVECPAISPNNRMIAFKKRVGNVVGRWRFSVLDLDTLADRPIAAETRSIDDQLEWLDDEHVLYATTRSSQSAVYDVWVAPIAGSEPARPLLAAADSPAVVR